MHLIDRRVSFASPRRGLAAYENSYYTGNTGVAKMRLRMHEVANDLMDDGLRSFSDDNGATWTETQHVALAEPRAGGVVRRLEATGFVDPVNGRMVHLINEGLLPNDRSEDAMTRYQLKYRVSTDGGRTTLLESHLMQEGDYSPEHPIEPVWVGRNALMTAGENAMLRMPSGHLLLVTNYTPLGEGGRYSTPPGIWNYMAIAVLFGEWQTDGRITWRLGPRMVLDPSQSPRGASEPTLGLLPDGRILMVIRGGNDGTPDLPGYKWYCVSDDEGLTWSEMAPWTFEDGGAFYSPGSVSQLMWHSSGRLLWLGNVSPANPQGNGPRYPLMIGEVDAATLLLRGNSLMEIDTLRQGEHPSLALSNFSAHEDRATGDIILHCTRMFTPADGWHGDAWVYRIGL